MQTIPLHHKMLTALGYVLGVTLIYACILKAIITSNSLFLMWLGFVFFIGLPYLAVNFMFTLLGAELNPAWMFAPVALAAFAPE